MHINSREVLVLANRLGVTRVAAMNMLKNRLRYANEPKVEQSPAPIGHNSIPALVDLTVNLVDAFTPDPVSPSPEPACPAPDFGGYDGGDSGGAGASGDY